eukprot:15367058-Ditylum_brightwellii.AAC.1
MYDEYGYPPDFVNGGIGVDSSVGIECEYMQRVKPLTYSVLVQMRITYTNKQKTDLEEKQKRSEEKKKKQIMEKFIIE